MDKSAIVLKSVAGFKPKDGTFFDAVRDALDFSEVSAHMEECKQDPLVACRDFVDAIDATGGAVRFPDGFVAPDADHDWIDLGEAYLKACAALGRKPRVRRARRNEL